MAFDGSDPCWIPRAPIGDFARWRMSAAKVNEGYQQRIPHGINAVERSWSLVWESRPAVDLAAMSEYLARQRGYAFPFRHPVTGVLHNVFCDEWDVDWSLSRLVDNNFGAFNSSLHYGTLSAEFRKANGSRSVTQYPPWLLLAGDYIPPIIQIDFANNRAWTRYGDVVAATSLVTCTRASVGMVEDLDGGWTTAQANVLRRTNKGVLVENTRTNAIRNNTWAGAVAGEPGITPGTQPTYWAQMNAASGITYTILGTGTEDGIAYIDISWVGTNTSGVNAALGLWYPANPSATTPVIAGEKWTSSLFISLVDGDYTGISPGAGVVTWEALETGAAQPGGISTTVYQATLADLTRQRIACTRTVNQVDTTRIFMQYRMGVLPDASVNIVLRFGLPQLEKGENMSSPIPSSTATVARAADIVRVISPGSYLASCAATTIYAQWNMNHLPANRAVIGSPVSWSAGSPNGQMIYLNVTTGQFYGQSYTASIADMSSTGIGNITDRATHKGAMSVSLNDGVIFRDGLVSAIDTAVAPYTGAATLIGVGYNSRNTSYYLEGYVHEIAVWPQRLPNDQLKDLTRV